MNAIMILLSRPQVSSGRNIQRDKYQYGVSLLRKNRRCSCTRRYRQWQRSTAGRTGTVNMTKRSRTPSRTDSAEEEANARWQLWFEQSPQQVEMAVGVSRLLRTLVKSLVLPPRHWFDPVHGA